MPRPDSIDAWRRLARQITDPMTDFLLRDIACRVAEAGQITSTAGYQIWKIQELEKSQKEVKKKLAELLNVSLDEIDEIFEQAAEEGYKFDLSKLPTVEGVPFEENESLQQIVKAAVTLAFKQVFTVAADYNTAVQMACRNLNQRGLVTVDYESGAKASIETAVRRNIMGGLGLMQEKISEQNHEKYGADGWEISAHAASAPDHEPIQGKQYRDEEYQELNNSLVRRIGTLNCGHAAFPIFYGVTEPTYTAEQLEDFKRAIADGITYQGKHYTTYEATQAQRRLETAIRKCKRKITVLEGAGDDDALKAARTRYTRLNQEYARFTKAAGLRTQTARLKAAGFSYKQGREAVKEIDTNQ